MGCGQYEAALEFQVLTYIVFFRTAEYTVQNIAGTCSFIIILTYVNPTQGMKIQAV
jgi:hypothetical protein